MLKSLCKKITMNNSFKLAVLIPLAFLIILILSFLILKNFFAYSIVENNFLNMTGLKLELVNPKTTFDFKFNLVLKSDFINVYDKNKTKKFICLKNPEVAFKPLGFLFKKVNFKKLNFEEVKITLKRNDKGEVDLINSLDEDFKKNLKNLNNEKFNLTRLNSKINDFEFVFEDNYKTKTLTKFHLNQNEIVISKKSSLFKILQKGTVEVNYNSNKQISDYNLFIQSKYPFNNINSKDLITDVSLKNINLFLFNDLAKKYISNDISQFLGNINLTLKTSKENSLQNLNLEIKNLALKLNDNRLIIPYKNSITLNSFFNLDKSILNLDSFEIKSNNLCLNIFGEISKIFSKKPETDLNISIKNTQLNNFTYLLPDNLIFYRPQGIPNLKKANFFATFDGDLNLKSFMPVDINGKVKVSNIHIPNYPKPYIQNDVNLTFIKDKMNVFARIYTPQNEYVAIDGVSNLDNSLYGKYFVKSTKKIDLDFAQKYLVPVQQIIGFNIGPVPIMKINGYGNIDIKTKGTLKDAQIFGNFEAYSANATLNGLATKLTNGDCKLVFDNRDLIFKEVRGKTNGADFLLTGKGNTKGEVELNAKISNARTSQLLDIFKNSTVSKPYSFLVKDIAAVSGISSIDINLKGTIADYETPELLNALALNGRAEFKNNKIILNNKLETKNLNGFLEFGESQNGIFETNINNSKFNVQFSSKDNLNKIINGEDIDFKSEIFSNKIAFYDIFNEAKKLTINSVQLEKYLKDIKPFNVYFKTKISSKGKINLNNINFQNIKNSGYIIGLNSSQNKDIIFKSGLIKINNDVLNFDNFKLQAFNGSLEASGKVYDIFSSKPKGDLGINLKNINLEKLNRIIPKIQFENSILKSGNIHFSGDDLKIGSLNIDYNSMPIFLNARVKNLYTNKFIQSDFSTIIDEKTSDLIINPYLTYPLKIKGEVPIKGSFKGTNSNYSIDFLAKVPKNSDVYFLGSNLGDVNYDREISGLVSINDNIAKISDFKILKYIQNQNSKTYPLDMLKVDGQIVENENQLFYKNLKFKTQTPLNVRVLNLIFKKSLLKKGNFECSILLNGNTKKPQIDGNLQLQDLDIPLYDTQINNINFNISKKYIDGVILAKNSKSDVKINLRALNNFEAPYILEKISVSSNYFNIMEVLNSLTTPTQQKTDITQKSEISIKPEDIIIKEGDFDFQNVIYDKINAKNLKGKFSYTNNVFDLKNIFLDIANGEVKGKGKYNLPLKKLDIAANMQDCDANILTKQFLNLQGQIFGKVNGSLILSTKNLDSMDVIKNTSSNVKFSINNGKMPKLGSLEYLLRAGNLIKNGILGLSLNNLIEVLTPYKTGEFEKISGEIKVKNAKIENLEIMSKGKNLSLFLEGNYNILENLADIKIYGKLSQNISNALGAIGNASISQFINSVVQKQKTNKDEEFYKNASKIPSIEIENPEPRYFKVRVLGDINKENYIKSFNWE